VRRQLEREPPAETHPPLRLMSIEVHISR
jgi:hypothetical protein